MIIVDPFSANRQSSLHALTSSTPEKRRGKEREEKEDEPP